ncbi:MAG: hypothetical protein ACETWG_01220 [Candidatus Neomarinimicrobiota bacterium]
MKSLEPEHIRQPFPAAGPALSIPVMVFLLTAQVNTEALSLEEQSSGLHCSLAVNPGYLAGATLTSPGVWRCGSPVLLTIPW